MVLAEWIHKGKDIGCRFYGQYKRGLSLFSTLFAALFDALLKYFGHATNSALKLCLQPCTHRLHIRLYCRRPFSPKKNVHSRFHALLLLICHAPACRVSSLREACVRSIHALHLSTVHEWMAFHLCRVGLLPLAHC